MHLKQIHFVYKFLLTFIVFINIHSPVFANPIATESALIKWQQPEYILKAFREIALKNEYQKTQHRILKWRKPIRYQFAYHDLPRNPMIETLFNLHFAHLQSITGHTIKQAAPNSNQVNLKIHLTRDANYGNVIQQFTGSTVQSIERDSNCMGSFRLNKGAISHATIVIPTDHAFSKGLLVACIVEESTQLMGLPNDSDWVNPSIANDASKIELLTGLDYLFLKLLYHPSIKPGMSDAQSRVRLKAIISAMRASGAIKTAQQRVNEGGLNLYLK